MNMIKGNAVSALIKGDVEFLLHITNCKGRMGSGIAKEIKQRIPEAFSIYRDTYDLSGLSLGLVTSAGHVYNMCAQDKYGYDGKRYLSYDALVTCLEKVKKDLDLYNRPCKIAVPFKMGSDRAGGEWEIVKAMVTTILNGHEIYIYKI